MTREEELIRICDALLASKYLIGESDPDLDLLRECLAAVKAQKPEAVCPDCGGRVSFVDRFVVCLDDDCKWFAIPRDEVRRPGVVPAQMPVRWQFAKDIYCSMMVNAHAPEDQLGICIAIDQADFFIAELEKVE